MENKIEIVETKPINCTDIKQYAQELSLKVQTAREMIVSSEIEMKIANDLKVDLRKSIKAINDARMEKTRPLDESKAIIKSLYDAIIAEPEKAMKEIDEKIMSCQRELNRQAMEARRQAEEEQRKELARLEARKQEVKREDTKERIEEKIEELKTFAPVPEVAQPKVKGISTITEYEIIVEDIDKVPDMFIIKTVDEKALKALAKTKAGNLKVEGIKFVEKQRIVSRG